MKPKQHCSKINLIILLKVVHFTKHNKYKTYPSIFIVHNISCICKHL